MFLMGCLVYGLTVFFPFVHDDLVLIKDNPLYQQPFRLSAFFGRSRISPQGAGMLANQYFRPALEIWCYGLYRLFGSRSTGYHVVNVLLHVINTVLLFFITRCLLLQTRAYPDSSRSDFEGQDSGTRVRLAAGGVAAAFLLHPVQSEAVASITGHSNLFMVFFCFSAFLLYLRDFDRQEARPGTVVFVPLLYLLALLTKEQAVILPFMIAWHTRLFAEKGRRSFLPFWTGVAAAGIALLIRKWSLAGGGCSWSGDGL